MSRILFTIVVVLTIVVWLLVEKNESLSAECSRLESNQNVYFDSMMRYKTQSGLWAVSVEALRLRCDELEQLLAQRSRIIDQLNIKLMRMEQFTQTAYTTQIVFSEPMAQDSVPSNDRQRFSWSDAWSRVEGVMENDSVSCRIAIQDTLHQIVHRVPRRFLFFRFGTKALRQEILWSNPNSRIVWSQYVNIEKSSRHRRY